MVGIRFYRPCEELRGIVARIYAHESSPSTLGTRAGSSSPTGDIKLIFPFAGCNSVPNRSTANACTKAIEAHPFWDAD